MAYHPNNTVPIITTGPHSNRSQEMPARAQRTNQVQYVEERLRNGLSPLTVAGVAALLTQLDTMQTLPGVSVSLVTEVAGYRRTLTCQNNAWDGHDLTHQFLDERSTTMLGPRARGSSRKRPCAWYLPMLQRCHHRWSHCLHQHRSRYQ